MSKHLVYGAQLFQLSEDADVETLANRFTDAEDSSAWVRFEDHAGDQHLVLRHAPFPIVLSQQAQIDPR
jgi:hypothetical protein